MNDRAPVLSIFWRTWVATLALATPAAAEADAAAAPDPGAAAQQPAPLQGVQVTATRAARSAYEVARAVTSINRRQIERETPQVLGEVFRGRVGTFFQQTTPGQGVVIIRGLKGSQILHLMDGMRINNAFFRNAPNQYLALVDPYMVSSLEAVRGSASTLYGADAMGGVLQVLTPDPEFTSSVWEVDGRVHAALASADSGRVIRAELQAGKRRLAVSGGLTYQEYGDRRTGGATVSPTGYESRAADTKLIYDLTPNSELMFAIQYLEQPSTPRVDELVPGFGQTEPSSSIFQFEPNKRAFYHARYRLEPSDAFVDRLEIHLAQQLITDDRRTQEFGETVVVEESNDSRLNGLTVQLDSGLRDDMNLTYGVEIYADEVSSSRVQTDPQTGVTVPVPARFPDGSTMDSVAIYAYDDWRVTPNWTLGFGLRYSRFELTFPDASTGGTAELTPDDLTGNVNFAYRVSPSVNLVGNLGRGFRPPNIFDLGTLGPRPGNRFNIPNAALEPESVVSADLGVKVATARWQAEAFAFYSDYSDKITTVATGAVTPEGRTVVRSENVNDVTIYGLETGARYYATTRIQAYGIVNYTRGDERFGDGTEQPADRIPPLNGKFGVVYAPRPALHIEPFVIFAQRQDRLSARDITDPRIDPNGTPGWATLNLQVDWQPSARIELGFRLENLTDKIYREHASGIDAPGFNFKLSLNAWF